MKFWGRLLVRLRPALAVSGRVRTRRGLSVCLDWLLLLPFCNALLANAPAGLAAAPSPGWTLFSSSARATRPLRPRGLHRAKRRCLSNTEATSGECMRVCGCSFPFLRCWGMSRCFLAVHACRSAVCAGVCRIGSLAAICCGMGRLTGGEGVDVSGNTGRLGDVWRYYLQSQRWEW